MLFLNLNAKARKRLILASTIACICGIGVGGLWVYRKHVVSQQYAQYREWGLHLAEHAGPTSPEAQEALNLLGKYIRRMPTDVEVLVAYAKLRQQVELPRNAHLVETMRILRHLLRLDPSRTEERRDLLRLYATTGFGTEALETAEQLLAEFPDDPEIIGLKAMVLVRLQRDAEALEAARRWAELSPRELNGQILTLWLMSRVERDSAGAVEYARELASRYPEDAQFEMLLGFALMLAEQVEPAQAALQQAAQRNPTDARLVRELVDKLDRLGLLSESLQLLRHATASHTAELDDAAAGEKIAREEIRQMLLRRLWQAGQYQEVLELLDQRMPSTRYLHLEAMGIKAISLYRLNRDQEAQKVVDELAAEEGELAAAWAMVPDFMSGRTYDEAGSRAMRDACLMALQVERRSPYLRQCLAEAYVQLGEPELAIKLYREIAIEHPAWIGPLARLSDLLMQRGRTTEAMEVAMLSLSRAPNNTIVAGTLVRVWDAAIQRRLRDDRDLLFDLARQIQVAHPGEEQSLPVYLRLLIEQGTRQASQTTDLNEKQRLIEEARQRAREALAAALAADNQPSQNALLSWAEFSREHNLGLEEECLNVCENYYGLTAGISFTRAYALYARGEVEAGRALLRQEHAAAAPTGRDAVSWALAEVRYLELIESPEAAEAWIRLADKYSDDLVVQQAAINIPVIHQDREFQARTIERIRVLTGESGQLWRLALARWHMSADPPDSEPAILLLNDVLRINPESVEARFLLAQSLDQLGNTPKAIEHMVAASRLDPDSRPVALYLAHLLQKSGDFTRAKEQLDRLTRIELVDAEQRRRTAILLAQQGDAGRAVELLERSEQNTRQEDLLLAQLYFRLNQYARAEQVSQRLLEHPDVAAISLAANLYAAMGQMDEAHRVLAQLDTIQVDPGMREIVLAEFQSRYGDQTRAIELLQQATRTAPTSRSTWQALICGFLEANQTDAALKAVNEALQHLPQDTVLQRVRTHQPLIRTAMERGFRPLAVGLVQLPDDSAIVDTARTLTQIDATHLARTLVDLQALADRYPHSLPVQLVVAERCLQLHQHDLTQRIAARATQAFPQHAEPPRLATISLMRQAKWEQALGMARLWRQRAGRDAMQADLAIVETMWQLRQDDQARQLLEPYVRDRAALDRQVPAVIAYALTLYRLQRGREADELLSSLGGDHPDLMHAWTLTAARQLPREPATRWVQEFVEQANTEQQKLMAVQVLHELSRRFDNAQANDQAETIATALEAANEVSADTLVVLASRREQMKQWQAAEKLYRRALEKGDPSGIIANNLAMVLVQLERPGEALPLAEEAAMQRPDIPNFRDTLATVQIAAGNLEAAIEAQRQAVLLAPGELKWRLTLMEMLVEAGRIDEVQQALRDADLILASAHVDAQQKQRLQTVRMAVQRLSSS